MPGRRRLIFAFGLASAAAGLVYWWHADWWAYVDSPEGPVPEFTMPVWWQVVEGGVVGCAAGGLTTLTLVAAGRVLSRRRGGVGRSPAHGPLREFRDE